jgi:hypothetical protein
MVPPELAPEVSAGRFKLVRRWGKEWGTEDCPGKERRQVAGGTTLLSIESVRTHLVYTQCDKTPQPGAIMELNDSPEACVCVGL